MEDNNEYFYLRLGIPRGPYTRNQFIQLAIDGKIKAKTSCIRNDDASLPASIFFGANWNKIETIISQKRQQADNEKQKAKEQRESEITQQRLAVEAERRQREQQRLHDLEVKQAELQQQKHNQPPTISTHYRPDNQVSSATVEVKNTKVVLLATLIPTGILLPIILSMTYVWIANSALQSKLDACHSSEVAKIRVWYANAFTQREVVFDYQQPKSATRRIDPVHLLMQFGDEIDLYSVEKVHLANNGKIIYYIDSVDFRPLVESYSNGGRIWSFNNLPSRVRTPIGIRVFEEWTGGLLGVLKAQTEDLGVLLETWLERDSSFGLQAGY